MRGIRKLLMPEGVIVIEVPYLRDLVEKCEFDKVYHQHLCYFSVTAVQHLFQQHALFLNDVRRVVVWGAGSKGVTFLNWLGCSLHQIAYLVDLNPRKHGRFVGGTGQEIVPPEFLRHNRPKTVLVMNPNYQQEIAVHLNEQGVEATLIVV